MKKQFELIKDDLDPVGRRFDSAPQLRPPPPDRSGQSFKIDPDNARAVYHFIEKTAQVEPDKIADEGLWLYLTHKTFFDYTLKRVPASKINDKQYAAQILRYWFIGERDFSNAIYSLYLIVKYTKAFEGNDWFEKYRNPDCDYARLVCQLPDYKMIFQHRMSRSPKMLFAILECVRGLQEDRHLSFGKYDLQNLTKLLSLKLPTRNLQMLACGDLIGEVRQLVFDLAERDYQFKTLDRQAVAEIKKAYYS